MRHDKNRTHKSGATIIVLLKNKLITTDAILPILMELKKRYASLIGIKLVFPNKATLKEVEKNLHLQKVLTGLQAESLFLRGAGRLSYLWKIVKLIFGILCGRTIIIKFSDEAFFKQKQLLGLLKKIAGCTEILGVLGVTTKAFRPEASNVLRTQNTSAASANEGRSLIDLETSDYVLSSMPASYIAEIYGVSVPDERLLYTGYYRGFPAWLEYVGHEKETYPVINDKDYFLYILTTLDKRLANINEPPIEELLEESLRALKKFNNRIRTVFKPHPSTNMERFGRVLDKVGYENFSIDYGHPMILSAKAKFVMANLFSTTLIDSYYLECPIIEYCQYDPRLVEMLNNKSHGQELCDFFIRRDPDKLEKIVSGVLDNEIKISRDRQYLSENFAPMPVRFFDFWDSKII
jgi:hypothetical protein